MVSKALVRGSRGRATRTCSPPASARWRVCPPSKCCIYDYTVDPALLLRTARHQAGLSIRGLSEIAGVSPSTTSRIETGRMDPTIGMLARLLEAAGCEMELAIYAKKAPSLALLVTAWEDSPRGDLIDWTRLRAFLDHLALHPDETASAIRNAPAPSGSALLDNLLAGIAETLADESGLPRPTWTSRIPPLGTPWSTPGTPRMKEAARLTTPPALSVRGLTLARMSLWRERSHDH